MKTIVIIGGSGDIGAESARKILAEGHRVILLGRDSHRGEQTLAALGVPGKRAQFLSADISTLDGQRESARKIADNTDTVDGLIHCAARFVTTDIRTVDGLNLFYALSFLSRYHITQLLLRQLLAADAPRVVMLVAGLKAVPKIDPAVFPDFKPYSFFKAVMPINGACMAYAEHLTHTHPKLFAATVSPGFVRSGIFKTAPWPLRVYAATVGRLQANTSELAAQNVVRAVLHGIGPDALNIPTAGDYASAFSILVDPTVEHTIIDTARRLTGV